jgi:hypothetical protein
VAAADESDQLRCPQCILKTVPDLPELYVLTSKPWAGHEAQQITWDVTEAWRLIRSRRGDSDDPYAGRLPLVFRPDFLAQALAYTEVLPAHLDHIPKSRRREPGVFARIAVGTADGGVEPRLAPVLIDGAHRAVLAIRDGWPFPCYLLTSEEDEACLRVGGADAFLSTLPPRVRQVVEVRRGRANALGGELPGETVPAMSYWPSREQARLLAPLYAGRLVEEARAHGNTDPAVEQFAEECARCYVDASPA